MIKKLVRAVPVSKIPDYIECTRAQAQHLLKTEFLESAVDDEKKSSGRHKGVDSDDLHRLLKQMRQNGKHVVNAGSGMVNVGVAANALPVSTRDIVSLFLKGTLENLEILPDDFKFRLFLVDLTEVSFKLGLQDSETGVTISDSARELGVHLEVVRFLLSASADSGYRAIESCGQYRHMGEKCDLVDPDSLDKIKNRSIEQFLCFFLGVNDLVFGLNMPPFLLLSSRRALKTKINFSTLGLNCLALRLC